MTIRLQHLWGEAIISITRRFTAASAATALGLALGSWSISPSQPSPDPSPAASASPTTSASASPTNSVAASATAQAAGTVKHKVGNGHVELEVPADWRLVGTGEYFEGQIHEDLKSTYSTRNAKGAEMAVLSTGIE